jgi:hypoxanthine phosphoribosyltransferase
MYFIDTSLYWFDFCSMSALVKKLQEYQPASVRVVALFLKRNKDSNGYIPNYVGFEVPNKFVCETSP